MSNMLKPIEIPSGVTAVLAPPRVKVKGPLGEIEREVPGQIEITSERDGRTLRVSRRNNDRQSRALHGTYRALIVNMVQGVTKGFEKKMQVHGTGYSVDVRGDNLVIVAGFTHDLSFTIPKGIKVEIEQKSAQPDNPAKFTVKGIDKETVGQFAANVRAANPPEPYKGKGIRYTDEHVIRKEGKAFGGIE